MFHRKKDLIKLMNYLSERKEDCKCFHPGIECTNYPDNYCKSIGGKLCKKVCRKFKKKDVEE